MPPQTSTEAEKERLHGKEIDWSLVIPSITRPVGEPLALEVIDTLAQIFEEDERDEDNWEDNIIEIFNLQSEKFKARYPDPTVRLALVDLISELAPLREYYDWTRRTLKDAKSIADQEKVEFYRKLAKEANVELREVGEEFRVLWNSLDRGLVLSGFNSETDLDEEGSDSGGESSELDTPSSYATARDDISTHSSDDIEEWALSEDAFKPTRRIESP